MLLYYLIWKCRMTARCDRARWIRRSIQMPVMTTSGWTNTAYQSTMTQKGLYDYRMICRLCHVPRKPKSYHSQMPATRDATMQVATEK